MKYTVGKLEMEMGQRGITCRAWLSVPNRLQYTDFEECIEVFTETRSRLLALWNLRQLMRKTVQSIQKMPGEYELTPTNYRPSLL